MNSGDIKLAGKEPAMRITRIDLEGKPGNYAVLTRRRGSDRIEIQVLTPDRETSAAIPANRIHELEAAAAKLQRQLDGYAGTPSEINHYLREIRRLAD